MRRNSAIYVLLMTALASILILFESVLPQPIAASFASSALLSICIGALAFHLLSTRSSPYTILFTFTLVFYVLGLLPITSRRNYIDSGFWTALLITSLAAMLAGSWLAKATARKREHHSTAAISKFRTLTIYGASLAAAIYIVSTAGLLLFKPEARFSVGSTWVYLVEFSIAATICIVSERFVSSKPLGRLMPVAIAAQSVMLLAIGYRNQLALLWLGIGLIYLFTKASKLRSRSIFVKSAAAAFAALLLMSALLYARIEFSGDSIISWNARIDQFDIVLADYMLPVLSIHDASRETMGVAQIAIDRIGDIQQSTSNVGFFFMDMMTLLPGHSETATALLGQVVGNSDEMYLVPGLIGALYISFGIIGVIAFYALAGFGLQRLWISYQRSGNARTFSLAIVAVIYLIQMTYRGIPKPMYIAAAIIVIYCFSSSRKISAQGSTEASGEK
ncbi:hypothetical protein ACX94F_00980 [Stenotrophomonas hibiscicola]